MQLNDNIKAKIQAEHDSWKDKLLAAKTKVLKHCSSMNILLYIARPMISLIHLAIVCFRSLKILARNVYEAWHEEHEKHEVNRLLECMNMYVKYEFGVWELKERKLGHYVSYPAIVKEHCGTLKKLLNNIFRAPYFTYTTYISKGEYVEFIDKRVENIFHGCVSLDEAKVRRDLHIR